MNIASPPSRAHPTPRRREFPRAWHVLLLMIVATAAAIASGLLLGDPPAWGRRGPESRFAFIERDPNGEAVRFDPCSEIRYVVNEENAPPGATGDLYRSIRLLGEATGLRFVYQGSTEEVPGFGRRAYQPHRYGRRWVPVLVGWVDGTSDRFGHGGLGIGKAVIRESDRGVRAIVSGWVMLNADAPLDAGFGTGNTWGEVLMHELAHVVGLAHVDDRRQIMFPEVTPGPARWGGGDLDGLGWVGNWGSCRRVPPPARG